MVVKLPDWLVWIYFALLMTARSHANTRRQADAAMPDRTADAVSHFEAALRMDPNLAEAHYHLGLLFAKMPGRSADAISYLDAAVRLDPRQPQAQRTLGMLLSKDPLRSPEVIAHLDAAQRLQPDPEVQRTLDALRSKNRK